MTKSELVIKRNKILETNSAIINEMTEPWEIAHQNAATICDLNRLIDEYLIGNSNAFDASDPSQHATFQPDYELPKQILPLASLCSREI